MTRLKAAKRQSIHKPHLRVPLEHRNQGVQQNGAGDSQEVGV